MIGKNFLILTACILVIIIVLVFFLFKGKTRQSVNEDFCDNIRINLLKNVCLATVSKNIGLCNNTGGYDIFCFDTVLEITDISKDLCEGMNYDYAKLKCYNELAIETKDSKFCKSEDCYIELASITSDERLCDFFSDGREDKYTCLAIANDDREYCENIETIVGRESCLKNLPQDLDDCNILNEYDYECLSKLAAKNMDTSICEMIGKDMPKIECILNIKNDLEICKDYTGSSGDICMIYYLKNELTG